MTPINMDLLLPRKRLSYTQMTLWMSNPERYKKQYFEGAPKLDTRHLRFGQGIASMVEDGTWKEQLPDLVVYPVTELEIHTTIAGVPILAYVDNYHPDLNVFREDKTGKIPWTQSKVQKHEQLIFYATALKAFKGTMPPYCHLDWIETMEDEGDGDFWSRADKKLKLTGKIVSFRRDFDAREIERMEKLVVKTAQEISKAYKQFIQTLDI